MRFDPGNGSLQDAVPNVLWLHVLPKQQDTKLRVQLLNVPGIDNTIALFVLYIMSMQSLTFSPSPLFGMRANSVFTGLLLTLFCVPVISFASLFYLLNVSNLHAFTLLRLDPNRC